MNYKNASAPGADRGAADVEGSTTENVRSIPHPTSARRLPDVLAPLIAERRWVIWRWETRGTGKRTKVPYRAADPQRKASSTDPNSWSDFHAATAAAENADGVGFCLYESEWAAFDVDDCRDPATSALDPWALELVERAGSYAEITVSGTGIRILGTGTGDKVHRKLRAPNGVTVEPYRRAERYIVVTGDQLPASASALADIDAVIDEVVAELGDFDTHANFGATDIPDIARDDPRLERLSSRWIALGWEGTGVAKDYGGDRSRGVFAFACECVRAGIVDDVIASCLTHWKIGEHIRDQNDVSRACGRVIERARQCVQDSMLFKMNEVHCVLPIGGKTRVATWEDNPDFPGRKTIAFSSSLADFKSLHNKYRHTYIDGEGNTVPKPRGTWWVGHPHRRQYDGGIRFMPDRNDEVVDNTLNLWQGFATAARKPEGKSGAAGCKRFLDHGLKVICSGDEAQYDYLIKREAFIAQRRSRSEIAVGYHTVIEGTGKGFWCRNINRLYGPSAMEVQNPEHVTGKHNPHLERLLRLTADEALFALDPRHRNALYNLITEPRIMIEPKFVDPYAVTNYLDIDVISNAEHFLPASGSARRFFVPTISSERANDHEYFREIEKELHDGGYEALLHHLLHEIDVGDFNVRAVPRTASLAEQMAYSRKGVDLLVEMACNEGFVPCPHQNYPDLTDCSDHHNGFDAYVRLSSDRELTRLGPLRIKRRLKSDWGCQTGKETRRQEGHVRVHGIQWPPLSELRERFVRKYGPQQWLCPSVEEWRGQQL